LNYAGIGVMAGQILTKVFEDVTLVSITRSDGFQKNYNEKLQCFIKQYNEFRLPEIENYLETDQPFFLNGQKTIKNDIADNLGVIVAYKAYEKLIQEDGDEKMLVGLPYDSKKLFWINFAQNYCSVERICKSLKKFESSYSMIIHLQPS
jgi:hypothetical protein